MGRTINPTLKRHWTDISVATPDAELIGRPQSNLMATLHPDLFCRLVLLRRGVKHPNTHLPADQTTGAVVVRKAAGTASIHLPKKRAQILTRSRRLEAPGTRAQAGVRLMEGTSTPTVIALEAARGFLRRLREGGIWLHLNSNVEAVDDGDIVVIWAEWDKSKLDGGSHAIEPLIGRAEVLVVAEGRWDQSAILSVVRVELDLPAPFGKDPVALLNRLVRRVHDQCLTRSYRPVFSWLM
mmetsp:Transcript_79905/g.191912  ORF Transcript_79905/g.191912 Transcript_79905/m.191912 type:complete len:239 (+) Transcript_79905:1368-2084(+)